MAEIKDKYDTCKFSRYCPTCGQVFYVEAFEAAKAFIDLYVADSDLTPEMVDCYAEYQEALKCLEAIKA